VIEPVAEAVFGLLCADTTTRKNRVVNNTIKKFVYRKERIKKSIIESIKSEKKVKKECEWKEVFAVTVVEVE
jgi:hypothetical protein